MTRNLVVSLLVVMGVARISAAQNTASAPAKPDYTLRVIEMAGKVRVAPIGTDPLKEAGWKEAKVGDVIAAGMSVRTASRSTAKLALEPAVPPSIVMFESNTLASVDELFKSAEPGTGKPVMVSRLGIAYGAIRAGVAEGDIRGDLEIRSPVATLAKRGTWDFRFFAESGTGNFQISLADRGLVQAIQNVTGQKVNINPGQFVSQAMSRWIDSIKFDTPVNIQDWYGLRGTELVFNLANQSGFGVLNAGGNAVNILNITGKENAEQFRQLLNEQRDKLQGQGAGGAAADMVNAALRNGVDQRLFGPRRRPEGSFGVGQGVIPVILGADSALVKQGGAQAGRMDFFRPDLVKFMNGH